MSTEKHVFLLPFAGGSSLLYSQWKLDGYIFHPVEYSGHGFRYLEPVAQNFSDFVEDTIGQIENVQPEEYFLFGHSMGGLLAWLIARRLSKKPKTLFISACEPPGYIDAIEYKKYMDEGILMQYITDYGRVSEKQKESRVFRKILLPVIQNDFRILSEYVYEPCAPLDIPLVVLYSKEDTRMRHEVMENWKEFGKDVRFEQLIGDHFYLEEEQNRRRILEIMEKVMTNV